MNIEAMTMDKVEKRFNEINELLDTENAEIDTKALSDELDALVARKATIEAEAAEKRAVREKAAGVKFAPIAEVEMKGNDEMNETVEIRNTKEYIDAYARYIKTGDPAECRALITENTTNGTIPVPEMVYDIVKNAWERDGIMSLVKKSYLKGNLKVSFEISSSEAALHTEGQSVNEEELELGIVELKPAAIKKWISISDEALDMTGEEYINYIYDELTYRIAKKAAKQLLATIDACGTVSTTTCVSVPVVDGTTIGVGTVAAAMAALSDVASDPVVVINKATWGALKAAQYANKFNVDPFEGLPVVFNNDILSYDAASTGDTYMIVGDFGNGALANFPNGEEITIKRDDYTLATSDLVRFIGREYVALGVIAPDAFVKVQKQ